MEVIELSTLNRSDGHMLPMIHRSLLNGETAVQIGDNKNLYDFVDVENYCAAQLLAAYNFLTIPPTTVGCQDLNYDYSNQGQGDKTGDPTSVAGHSFFITNLEPVYFWTWIRTVWSYLAMNIDESSLDDELEKKKKAMPKEGRIAPPPADQHFAQHNASTPIISHHWWSSADPSHQTPKNRYSGISSHSLSASFSRNQATPFSFSPTTPLPAPYKPYSPPPPPFPKNSPISAEPHIKVPISAGLFIGLVAEFVSSTIRHKEPGLTRNRVKECCYSRWYRGDKAGHVMGYWGGLARDSMGYEMGGVGLWYGTKRAVVYYLKELAESKNKNKSGHVSIVSSNSHPPGDSTGVRVGYLR